MTQHGLSWPCAVQLCKFTCIDLPTGSTGKASSQPSTSTKQKQQVTKLEELTVQLQRMTYERDELSLILDHYTDKDLNR